MNKATKGRRKSDLTPKKFYPAMARNKVSLENDTSVAKTEVAHVQGTIRNGNGRPAVGVQVQAFNKLLRDEESLGTTATGMDGTYRIEYRSVRRCDASKSVINLIVRAYGDKGIQLASSVVIVGAKPDEQIDLTIHVANEVETEFETVFQAVTQKLQLAKLEIAKLKNTPDNPEISILAGELCMPVTHVLTLVESVKVAQILREAAEVSVTTVLQKGTSLKRAPSGNGKAPSNLQLTSCVYGCFRRFNRLSVDDLQSRSDEEVRSAVMEAVVQRIIPEKSNKHITPFLKWLHSYRLATLLQPQDRTHPNSKFRDLLDAVNVVPIAQTALAEAVVRYGLGTESFWANIAKHKAISTDTSIALRTAMQIVDLNGSDAIPLQKVVRLLDRKRVKLTPKSLVSLRLGDWERIIEDRNKAGAEVIKKGKVLQRERRARAAHLKQLVEHLYPTETLLHRLATDTGKQHPLVKQRRDIETFVANNPDFNVLTTPVSSVLTGNRKTDAPRLRDLREREETVELISTYQRLIKLLPEPEFKHSLLDRYEVVKELMNAGILSGIHMAAWPKHEIINKYRRILGDDVPERIHDRAVWVTNASVAKAIQAKELADEPFSIVLPRAASWAEMFGPTELCECEQCTSMHSPAAYLFDTLKFLADSPQISGKTAFDVLRTRRPDLQRIALTCENTNRRLPYIDLVNEVLEQNVAPKYFRSFPLPVGASADLDAGRVSTLVRDHFVKSVNHINLSVEAKVGIVATFPKEDTIAWNLVDQGRLYHITRQTDLLKSPVAKWMGFQTIGTEEELKAAPAHVISQAYEKLHGMFHPWMFPFDLNAIEMRAYLSKLNLNLHDIGDAFAIIGLPDAAAQENVAAAYLGMTSVEWAVVNGDRTWGESPFNGAPGANNDVPQEFWGFPRNVPSTEVPWDVQLQEVPEFLHRTELIYVQLLELLNCDFVNPLKVEDRDLTIQSTDPNDPATCELLKLEIHGLTTDHLKKIHRFIRAQRKLGWHCYDLDRALRALGSSDLDKNTLVALSLIERIRKTTQLELHELLTWWGPIDHARYRDYSTPLQTVIPSLYEVLFRRNPQVSQPDPVFAEHPDNIDPAAKIVKHSTSVLAALNISESDLEAMRTDLRILLSANANSLNLQTLSTLFRYASLAHAIGRSINELLWIMDALGTVPFDNLISQPDQLVSKTFEFLSLLDAVDHSGLTAQELKYVLTGEDLNVAPAQTYEEIAGILEASRETLRKELAEVTYPSDSTGELVAKELVKLGWKPNDAVRAGRFFAGREVYGEKLTFKELGNVKLPADSPVTFDENAEVLRITGAMTTAEKSALRSLAGSRSVYDAYRGTIDRLYNQPRDYAVKQLGTIVPETRTIALAELPNDWRIPKQYEGHLIYDRVDRQLVFKGPVELLDHTDFPAGTDLKTAVRDLAKTPPPASVNVTPLPSENRFFSDLSAANTFFAQLTTAEERCGAALQRIRQLRWTTVSPRIVAESLGGSMGLSVEQMYRCRSIWQDLVLDTTNSSLNTPSSFVTTAGPITQNTHQDEFTIIRRLHKLGVLLQRLGLPGLTSEWLIEHSERIGGPNFLSLPADSNYAPIHRDRFVALMTFARIYTRLGTARGTVTDLFDLAIRIPGATRRDWLDRAVEITQWRKADVEALVPETIYSFPNDFRPVSFYERLVSRMEIVTKTGLAASTVIDWHDNLTAGDHLSSHISTEMVGDAKSAVESQFDRKQWLQVAREINDPLRELRRDALVSYLLAKTTLPGGAKLKDKSALFDYLLIDTEMDSCMLTSRLKQAMSSVQTFVQRVLMNLEPDCALTENQAKEWGEWRKQYRTWEANRKVFLYPESWLEPEFRQNKSQTLKKIESDLLSNALSMEVGVTGVRKYLDELTQLSRLEILSAWATHKQGSRSWNIFDLIIIARSPSHPRVFYERRYSCKSGFASGRWGPWERIDIDIEGDHIVPLLWRETPYLFWLIFQDDSDSADDSDKRPQKWRIDFAWSKWTGQGWQPKQLYTGPKIILDKPVHKCPLESLFVQAELQPKFDSLGTMVPVINCYRGIDRSPFGDIPPTIAVTTVQQSSPGGKANVQVNVRLQISPQSYEEVKDARVLFATATHLHPYRIVGVSANPYVLVVLFDENKYTSLRTVIGSIAVPDGLLVKDGVDYIITVTLTRKIATTPSTDPDRPLDMVQFGRFLMSSSEEVFTEGFGIGRRPPPPSPRTNLDIPLGMQAKGTWFLSDHQPGNAVRFPGFNGQHPVGYPAFPFRLIPLAQHPNELKEHIFFLQIETRTYALMVPSPFEADQRVKAITFFHPYSDFIQRNLAAEGVQKALPYSIQILDDAGSVNLIDETGRPFTTLCGDGFLKVVNPDLLGNVDNRNLPSDRFAFELNDPYALYNWELFFHLPFLVAKQLSRNQRFEEAQWWLHLIFDPTATLLPDIPLPHESPARFWRTKPLREIAQNPPMTLSALLQSEQWLAPQVNIWKSNPFDPFAIAEARQVALMKATVTTYLDNLIAWADQLFQRDTLESMNEATQLYILASQILGPRAERVPARTTSISHTYESLAIAARNVGPAQASVGAIAVEISSYIDPAAIPQDNGPSGSAGTMMYFCLSENPKLLAYWDTIEDRLFKIRHCLDIGGRFRIPALFEPPIDPALLIRARAAGIDIADALSDLYAPLPHYRFSVLAQKVTELCAEVKSLGGALLSAMEKRDAEALALLRQRHEGSLLELTKLIREEQKKEARAQIEALDKSREMVAERLKYYQRLLGKTEVVIPKAGEQGQRESYLPSTQNIPGPDADMKGLALTQNEVDQIGWLDVANNYMWASSIVSIIAATGHFVPNFSWGAPGFSTSYGGSNVGSGLDSISRLFSALSSNAAYQANRSSILGGHARRQDEWTFQSNLAAREFAQIDKQIATALIREAISEKEFNHHAKQMEQSKEVESFLERKFTNQQLFDWMVAQVSTIYFQSYQLAYKLAKRAEKAYQFELGIQDSEFIKFGYWDSLKKGLLAGEKLHQDVKRMEVAYLDGNAREYEITKHVSLVALNPSALVDLKSKGECTIDIPEWVYDLDYPGHYLRRIKTVSVTIPCVVGPYSGVNCTLTLLASQIRSSIDPGPTYPRKLDDDGVPIEDSRFTDTLGAAQSIVTTTAQNDTGLFETNLRDERYLPFEGRGAISRWHLALPRSTNSFDPNSVTDVILHFRYTAREGGRNLADAARTALKTFLEKSTNRPLYRLFSLRHEFPSEWNRFLSNGGPIGPLNIKDRFPLLFSRHTIKVGQDRSYFAIDTKRNIQSVKVNKGMIIQLSGKTGEVDIDTPSQTIDLKPNETPLDLLIICNYSLKLRDP